MTQNRRKDFPHSGKPGWGSQASHELTYKSASYPGGRPATHRPPPARQQMSLFRLVFNHYRHYARRREIAGSIYDRQFQRISALDEILTVKHS
jgi:hypothetical protein